MRLLLLLALLAVAPVRAADLAIVDATVIVSPDAQPLASATVVVRNGRIAAVGRAADVRVPAGAQVIDGRGRFVVAGLWNSHVHVITPDLLDAANRPAAVLERELRRMLLSRGFTTAFDITSVPGNTLALRRRIERGNVTGPLLLTVDAPFYPRDGTPIYVRALYRERGWPSAEVASPAEAAARARRQLAAGADGVKLFTGAIVGGVQDVVPMDVDIARAAVAAAHARGKPAFAHPTNLRGLTVAVNAGVDVLAHPTSSGGEWPASLAARLVAKNVALVPTLALFEIELAKERAPEAVRARLVGHALAQVRSVAGAGGTILFGTDVGYIDEADTTRELALMAEAGLDWRAILASLTTAPSTKFGYASRKGRISAGMDGDLVVLGRDPTRDATAFADVRFTIRGGTIVYRAP